MVLKNFSNSVIIHRKEKIIYAAQLAAAVSGNYRMISGYIDKLSLERYENNDNDFLKLINRAIALGYGDKWKD